MSGQRIQEMERQVRGRSGPLELRCKAENVAIATEYGVVGF
jgi:hypothetical protein